MFNFNSLISLVLSRILSSFSLLLVHIQKFTHLWYWLPFKWNFLMSFTQNIYSTLFTRHLWSIPEQMLTHNLFVFETTLTLITPSSCRWRFQIIFYFVCTKRCIRLMLMLEWELRIFVHKASCLSTRMSQIFRSSFTPLSFLLRCSFTC